MVADLARDEQPLADELGDAVLDMLDRDALQVQVERGLAQPIGVEGGFALGMDAHRRGDGELRARGGRRDDDARDRAVDQRIGGGEQVADKRARRLHRLADHLIAAIERTAHHMALACDLAFGIAQDLLAIETKPGRLVLPVLLQEGAVLDIELGVAGARGDAAQALRAFQPETFGGRQYVGTALAEGVDDVLGHAGDLEGAVLAGRLDLIAELLHLAAQIGMIDRADDGVAGPDLVGMQRLPFATRHTGHVGDDRMDMRLRVERSARVVLEQAVGEIARGDRYFPPVYVLASLREVLLDPGHGLADGGHMRAVLAEDALVAGDIGHERDRLGCREGQVDAGTPVLDLADLLARGQLAVERALQVRLADIAGEPGGFGAGPGPDADLAGVLAGIVIGGGEVVLAIVIGRARGGANGCNGEHQSPIPMPSSPRSAVAWRISTSA